MCCEQLINFELEQTRKIGECSKMSVCVEKVCVCLRSQVRVCVCVQAGPRVCSLRVRVCVR